MPQHYLEHIKKLQAEQQRSMKKLDCSLAIQGLWPDCKWPVSTYIAGGFSEGFYFHMRDKTNTIKKLTLFDMPEVFKRRDHIKRAIQHIKNNNYKGKYKTITINNGGVKNETN